MSWGSIMGDMHLMKTYNAMKVLEGQCVADCRMMISPALISGQHSTYEIFNNITPWKLNEAYPSAIGEKNDIA
jgi:hypothetical protein